MSTIFFRYVFGQIGRFLKYPLLGITRLGDPIFVGRPQSGLNDARVLGMDCEFIYINFSSQGDH